MGRVTLTDLAQRLLDLVDARKGDQWWSPCCTGCYYEPWHRERLDGVTVGDETWKAKVPRCDCVCHEARKRLGIEDDIHDPRWRTPPG